MKTAVQFLRNDSRLAPREWIGFALLWSGAMLLSTLDQCTRGPSLTAWALTHASTLASYLA